MGPRAARAEEALKISQGKISERILEAYPWMVDTVIIYDA